VTPLVLYLVGLVVLAAATTSAYLAMRDVMAIGGSCASGGPYEVAVPCPKGTGTLMVGGIFGWFLGAGLTGVAGSQLPGDYGSLALLAWPGLFLSLGWNFLDFGFDPADGGGTDAGLVFCGVLFFLMGGVPLLFGLKGLARALWPAPTPREASGRWHLSGQVRAATSRAEPRIVDARSSRARTGSKAKPAPTEPRAGKPAPATAPVDASPVDAPPADATPEDAPTVDGDAGSGGDIVGELERLTDLHSRGALDDDEFERAKDILLGAGEDRP
jgi:hypothetical protein